MTVSINEQVAARKVTVRPAGRATSFLQFTRHGAVVAVATMVVWAPHLWLRYFVLA